MIPLQEISAIVDICVASVRRRRQGARAFDRGELVNEAWRIALEALPRQRRAGVPIGPYLGFAIVKSLGRAIRQWSKDLPVPSAAPDVADPAPSAEAMLLARASAVRVLDGLSDLDRGIVGELLGAGGRRAGDARSVALAFGVPVGRVYRARQELARRAGVCPRSRAARFDVRAGVTS